jgi:hypothetical protein
LGRTTLTRRQHLPSGPRPGTFFEVFLSRSRTIELQTRHGILNHENLIFDDLIVDRKYQFVFLFVPGPIKGATGSSGCPIALT